ncbi:MAG: MFS transporter [Ruminococcaceae bacterium]|nr:MFS transporter [Oscillospiraceae bacterium]
MDANALKRRSVSRISYYALCALNYISALLLSDVFLVDVLQYVGLDDGAIGIVNSAIGFLAFVQILLLFIGHKIRNPKPLIFLGYGGMAVMFVLTHIFALLPLETQLKQALIIASLMLGRLIVSFASPLLSSYIYTFISYRERGTVGATNNAVSLATAIVFTIAISEIRDYYRESGNVEQGLFITAVFLAVVAVFTIISVIMMRGTTQHSSDSKPATGIRDVLRHTLGSKSFLYMLLFFIIWQIASTITINFQGIYKLNELGFSLSTVQIIGTVGNITTMLLARPMGKLADRRSHQLCLKLGLVGVILSFLIGAFTAPETAWLIVVYTILFGISNLALSSCAHNMLLEFVGPTYYMYSLSLVACISGIFSFGISFLAAWLLETIQSMGNTLFGMTVYAQQILSAISAVLSLGLLAFAHFILTKLPKQKLSDLPNE